MDVVIAGGHGRIGLQLGRLLAERGDRVRGLIRAPTQADALVEGGVEPVLCDLEGDADVAGPVEGAEAIVFAAGAGPGSGPERKWALDYGGAVKLIEAARAAGARRYVMVSSMGAAEPPPGRVQIGEGLERGQIPRADVVAVLGAVLPAHSTIGRAFELVSGERPVEEAVAGLGGAP